MENAAIDISGVRKRFGRREVLKGVDLSVPRGSIFGLLGRNGAGKSTLIKAMLGLLKFDGGKCRVLGIDTAVDPVGIRRRVGYMAENQSMYGWMTVRQIIDWVGKFYPTWDKPLAAELQDHFALDGTQKVGALSKGQTSKLALLLALAHRPELVVLDDPTLGLDPIARKDFLREVIGQLQQRGITVFFSSHL
ncbi:MAG TPA: ABC transporter ATP-binding protein, partial [Phycisphaerae bacterium]